MASLEALARDTGGAIVSDDCGDAITFYYVNENDDMVRCVMGIFEDTCIKDIANHTGQPVLFEEVWYFPDEMEQSAKMLFDNEGPDVVYVTCRHRCIDGGTFLGYIENRAGSLTPSRIWSSYDINDAVSGLARDWQCIVYDDSEQLQLVHNNISTCV